MAGYVVVLYTKYLEYKMANEESTDILPVFNLKFLTVLLRYLSSGCTSVTMDLDLLAL